MDAPQASQPRSSFRALQFVLAAMLSMVGAATAYGMIVLSKMSSSPIPQTYKWLLLQEVSGPRLIIESGSNSHHGVDTDFLAMELGLTAINVADNGGYDLEDKVERLLSFTRAGDTVVLPLEYSYYTRNNLTDDYVDSLFSVNGSYVTSQPPIRQAKRLLSVPPMDAFSTSESAKLSLNELVRELHIATTLQTTGHRASPEAGSLAAGVAGQSCDEYLFGRDENFRDLEPSKKFLRAMTRLKELERSGVRVFFAWPAVVGDGCLTSTPDLMAYLDRIETTVRAWGFEFLGTPTAAAYPLEWRNDTPYHLIEQGAAVHTRRLAMLLRTAGVTGSGAQDDIRDQLERRIYELELAQVGITTLTPLEPDQTVSVGAAQDRDFLSFSAGWWSDEPYGRWMRGERALLQLSIDAGVDPAGTILLDGAVAGGEQSRVRVLYKGSVLADSLFGHGRPLAVPSESLPRDQVVHLVIELPEAGQVLSPQERGENTDPRTMSLRLAGIRIDTNNRADPPVIVSPERQIVAVTAELAGVAPVPEPYVSSTATEIKMTTNAPLPKVLPHLAIGQCAGDRLIASAPIIELDANFDSAPLVDSDHGLPLNTILQAGSVGSENLIQFESGWWDQEPGGRWMQSQHAALSVLLPASLPSDAALVIYGDAFAGGLQPVRVKIAGEIAIDAEFGLGQPVIIPVASRSGWTQLEFEFPEAPLISPADAGLSTDTRTLTGFVAAIELVVPAG